MTDRITEIVARLQSEFSYIDIDSSTTDGEGGLYYDPEWRALVEAVLRLAIEVG